MSLANLSIIEKDDLIKKMPKDALKRELRDPTGNLPLYMIAARLKEVETMEKEFQAKQFAQEAQGEEPTIAHRLAREVMPQAPISGMAAMPSPQQRPDPQGQMAQQLAGPQNPMPTVYAQSGLKGAYPGDAPRVTAEMLAAAARRRKDKGKSRLYNQDRKSSFEETIKKGASPATQMAAMFGIPSAIARQEERVYGGLDTLPPFQSEYNALALRSKGFTSPTRTLSPGKVSEDASGLDYLKIMKSIAGDTDDLPTVFTRNGYDPNEFIDRGDGTLVSMRELMGGIIDEDEPVPPLVKMQEGFPLKMGKRPAPPSLGLVNNQPFGAGLADASNASPRTSQALRGAPRGRTLGDMMSEVPEEMRSVIDRRTGETREIPLNPVERLGSALFSGNQSGKNFNKTAAIIENQDLSSPLSSPPTVSMGDAVTVEKTTSSSPSAVPSAAPGVTPSAAQVARAALPGVNVPGLGQRLGSGAKAVEIGDVGTIKGFHDIYSGLLPDNSEARKKITKDLEATFKEERERDAVPKGLRDIRSEYENRIKALDNSGLPFMTAAAAVLKGNQPTLVALTNAMIGYTAGNEQVKKQGLSLIKDMSKLDMDIATLDAAQREQARKAQVRLMQAREAEIKGDEDRAAKTLELAGKARASAQALAVEKAKIESAAENRATQLAVATVKTDADRRAVDELTTANFAILRADPKNKGKSDELLRAEAIKASVMAIQGRATSSFAAMAADRAAQDQRNQLTGLADRFYNDYFKNAGPNERIRLSNIDGAPKKASLRELLEWGVRTGNVTLPADMDKQLKGMIEQRAGKQAQGGGQAGQRPVPYSSLNQ